MNVVTGGNFLLGVNYWPRRKAMYWWKRFDLPEVDEEFAQIAEWGLQAVRFCLLWEDFQPAPDLIDTEQLNRLVKVMDAAQKHGLRAIPTLLAGNMSGAIWLPLWVYSNETQPGKQLQISDGRYVDRRLRSPFDNPTMLRAEWRLARQAAAVVANHPALHSWDLANEIDEALVPDSPDAGWLWAWCLSEAIRSADDDVLITYGAHSLSLTTNGLTLPAITPSLDYLSMHAYPFYAGMARDPLDPEWAPFLTVLTAQLGDKPAMMQEFGVCTAPPGEPTHEIQDVFLGDKKEQVMASEDDAAQYYAAVLDRLWEVGALGALAWDYADYTSDLWTLPPLDRAIRERTFGIFRADGSPKPAAEVLRRFATEMKNGELEHRLGAQGAKAVPLDVDAPAYYQSPLQSLGAMYTRYLERIQQTVAAGGQHHGNSL